jgi:ribokinase
VDRIGDNPRVRVAVVGHAEWVRFAQVPRMPRPGEIVHAARGWDDVGGGGAVAAVQLLRLAGEASFFTALGDDRHGRAAVERLRELGVRVHAAWRPDPQRLAFTHLDDGGERTITIVGPRNAPRGDDPLPWEELAGADAVYFTAGDLPALRAARGARVLVATPRAREALIGGGVALDALVRSASDEGERVEADGLAPPPSLDVATDGSRGGHWTAAEGRTGTWTGAPLPGPVADAYGCGDSFAAGLTYGLGATGSVEEALDLAARCGAACLTGAGPYEAQLSLSG